MEQLDTNVTLIAENINHLPTVEIGRWAARIGIANIVFQFDPQITGGWAPDDPVGEILHRRIDEPKTQSSELYEKAITYELKFQGITADKVERVLQPQVLTGNQIIDDAEKLRRDVYVEGLERLGVVEKRKNLQKTITIGAFAALCYMRANIHEPIDRALYEREEEIEVIVQKIKSAIHLRNTIEVFDVKPINYTTKEPYKNGIPIYQYCFFRANPGQLQQLGGTTAREAFWAELQRDMAQIDTISDNL
jgi:hypothetical protein